MFLSYFPLEFEGLSDAKCTAFCSFPSYLILEVSSFSFLLEGFLKTQIPLYLHTFLFFFPPEVLTEDNQIVNSPKEVFMS